MLDLSFEEIEKKYKMNVTGVTGYPTFANIVQCHLVDKSEE